MKIRVSAITTAALLLAMSAALAIVPAQAGDSEVRGGNGGGYFRDACESGSYLIGLNVRHGAWIDNVQPVCARWDGQFGTRYNGGSHGGGGGGPGQLFCPVGQIPTALGLEFNTGPFVATVGAACRDAVTDALGKFVEIGTRPNGEPTVPVQDQPRLALVFSSCPGGEVAVGIHGRSGSFVDALGLICGPRPYSDVPRHGTTTCVNRGDGKVSCSYPQIRDAGGVSHLLDWCRSWGAECGKPAADAYCRQANQFYPIAESFRQAIDIGQVRPTLVISSKQRCDGGHCDGFKSITCIRDNTPTPPPSSPPSTPPSTPTPSPSGGTETYPDLPNAGPSESVRLSKKIFSYRYPHIQSPTGRYLLLDWCRTWATNCGKAAADEFCHQQHGRKFRALDFGEAKKISARRATMTIASQEVCSQPNCSGFQYITCKKK